MPRKTNPALTTVGKFSLTLNGKVIPYTVRQSSRARWVRLEMNRDTGFIVIVPESYDLAHLPPLIESRKRWILNNFPRFTTKPSFNGSIPYLGRDLKLLKRQDGANLSTVQLEPHSLVVTLGNGSRLGEVLEQWYRQQAEDFIRRRIEDLSRRMRLWHNGLTLRGQKTRWGSCSRKGKLSLNWKLIMTPEPVIDYIIIHELAHLREMNHSKRFWKLVAEHCAGWRERRRWLKEHECYLGDLCRQIEINHPDSA